MLDNKRILIAAGGTGGHINPALGTAGYIKEHAENAQIVFVGTADKMEATLVPQAGYELRTIEISGFWRSFSPEAVKHNIGTVVKLVKSSSQVKKIINDFRLLKHIEQVTKEISISILDQNIKCIALLDSGNLLQDPVSKSDVVIIKASLLENFLPKDCNFEKMDISDIQSITDNLSPKISCRVRLIPYKHVGDNNAGMLLGIKADYLNVDDKKIGNIILGISDFKDKEYSAILNPRILC